MSYLSIRKATPIIGKHMVLENRISAVMARHGAKSALLKVMAGDGAGCYDFQNWYVSLEEVANSFQAYGAVVEYHAFMHERTLDQVADVLVLVLAICFMSYKKALNRLWCTEIITFQD